jgi:anthranilate 1,2-dioxygenase small subunit
MAGGTWIQEISNLNDRYARCIDEDLLEQWPDLFTEKCLYRVTTADNFRRNLPAGLIFADTRAMLKDRIASLRKANVYEQHRYRHVIGAPAVHEERDGMIVSESAFLVIRIMRDGTMTIFATGKYVDKIFVENASMAFARRVVVCDGGNIDALLAIPL